MARHFVAALAVLSLAALSSLPCTNAFYLPGAAPKDYIEGDKVPVHVNRLNPMIGALDSKIVRVASFFVGVSSMQSV